MEKMKKDLFGIFAVIAAVAAISLLAGCGGGGGGTAATSYSVSGTLQIPNTTTGASRVAYAMAAATGTVQIVQVSGTGTETAVGDPVTTDSSGQYTVVVSSATSFNSVPLVAKAVVRTPDGATATLRSHITGYTADINPITEATYQIVQEKIVMEGKTYSAISVSEVQSIETAVETAVGTSVDNQAGTLEAIVNNAKNTAAFDSGVQSALNTAVDTTATTMNYLVMANTPTSWTETQGDFAYMALTGSASITPSPTYNFLTPNPVMSDVDIAVDGDYVFVLNRYNYDTVVVLDASSGFSVVANYSLKASTTDSTYNPQDIEIVSSTKAYVTLYEKDYVLVINPMTGTQTGTISLASYAQHFEGNSQNWDGSTVFVSDDIPEASKMVKVGTKVFVAVQNLDRASSWSTTDYSKLVVIDTTSDTAVAGIDLSTNCGHNPTGSPVYANNKIYIACTGNTTLPSGTEPAGIASVDPDTYTVTNIVTRQSSDACAPHNIAIVSATKGYFTCLQAWPNSAVYSFNPSTGVVDRDNPLFEGSLGFSLVIDPDGNLVVPSRSTTAPGLLFFDTSTDQQVYSGVISVGLAPEAINFVTITP